MDGSSFALNTSYQDPEVAETVFEECIIAMLKGKTRLLVTNQLQCLSRCDSVIALGGGRVLEQGKYDDLIKDSNGEVFRLLRGGINASSKNAFKQQQQQPKGDASTEDDPEKPDPLKEHKKLGLMTKEEREEGTVKLKVYLEYIKAGGGLLLFACVFFIFILSTCANVLTTVWVAVWSKWYRSS